MAAGADAHIRNGKGWAAVHSAAAAGQLEVVLRLVAAGAAPRARPELDVLRLLTRKTSYKWDPDSALSQRHCPSCINTCGPSPYSMRASAVHTFAGRALATF